jgi:hypothetical protein
MQKNSISKNKLYDEDIYRLRHQEKNLFTRLKHFRGIATRFDKFKKELRGSGSPSVCLYLVKALMQGHQTSTAPNNSFKKMVPKTRFPSAILYLSILNKASQ